MESFNGKRRYDFLNHGVIGTLWEAKVLCSIWVGLYNKRPSNALGMASYARGICFRGVGMDGVL